LQKKKKKKEERRYFSFLYGINKSVTNTLAESRVELSSVGRRTRSRRLSVQVQATNRDTDGCDSIEG